MFTTRSVLSRGTFAAVLLFLFSGAVSTQGPPQIERDIVISTAAGGDCVVSGSPSLIQGARPGTRIIWHVRNNCSGSRTVGVDNFQHRQDNNRRKDPLNLDPFPSVPQGGSGDIRGRVKPNLPAADDGRYKYDILIDGRVAEDPELEIER